MHSGQEGFFRIRDKQSEATNVHDAFHTQSIRGVKEEKGMISRIHFRDVHHGITYNKGDTQATGTSGSDQF